MQKNEKSICLYGREANNTEKNIPQKSLLEMFLENVNKMRIHLQLFMTV